MPAEERKLVSVLFVDIVDSTARAQGADPEDIRDLLRRFYEPARREIELHGGVLEKFIGDAVVAVFGAPRAHGDDAARAVRCALRIAAAVEELNRADPDLRLAIRAAVATGEALVELGSNADRGEAIAIGDVLNTAARLQSAAPPGGVVVGAGTERATRRVIAYEPLPAVAAKGFPEPLAAWRALSIAGDGASRAPLLGRDAELGILQGAFEAARAARGPQVVTVLGPPGIGKTRLTTEFCTWARQQGGTVYRGRCLPYAERRAYQASVDQIKQAAGIFEEDAPLTARSKLESLVAATLSAEDVEALTRPLSVLLALGVDEPLGAPQILHFAARRLVEGLAAQAPAVFLFEDLHWGDESQFELLEYLRDRVRDAAAVLLVVGRPELAEVHASWTAARAGATVELQPLGEDAAQELAAALLGPAAAGRDLSAMLGTAGGNPLFLEELTASVREGAAEIERLPVTVREAIAAHIDALPDDQRSLLLDASVIGQTFWRGVLTAASARDGDAVGAALAELASRGLVHRADLSRVQDDEQFAFKHGLVQEVAYGTLTRADRQVRHRAVAAYVESRIASQKRDLAAFLAHHWRGAGDRDKAIEHLLVAAESARDVFAEKEAMAHFGSALELASGDVELRRSIQLRQASALVRLGDYPPAAEILDAVIPELTGRDEVEAVMARVMCAYWMEDTEGSLRLAAAGKQLAQRLGDPELLAVAALHEGMPHEYTGDLARIRVAYDEARRLWVKGTRRAELAALNEYDADSRYWTGEYAAAEESARLAHEMGGEVHQLHALLRGGGWQGLCMAAQGRSEEAITQLEQIYGLSQELDSRWGSATLNYWSLPLRDMLRLKDAREKNEQSLELVSARGAWGMAELQAEIDLCLTDLLEGNPGRVQRDFPKLWSAAINGKAWRPWLGGLRLALVRAELARQTESPAEAAAFAQDALDRARAGHRPKYQAASRALLGTALIKLGRSAEGIAELRQAVATADALGSPGARWQLRLDLASGLAATGDDSGAEVTTREAAGVMREYAAGLSEANAAGFLAAEPVRSTLRAG